MIFKKHINRFFDVLANELWSRVLKKHYDEWEVQRMKERDDLWREIMETPDGEE